jgi:hypothetical protein
MSGRDLLAPLPSAFARREYSPTGFSQHNSTLAPKKAWELHRDPPPRCRSRGYCLGKEYGLGRAGAIGLWRVAGVRRRLVVCHLFDLVGSFGTRVLSFGTCPTVDLEQPYCGRRADSKGFRNYTPAGALISQAD